MGLSHFMSSGSQFRLDSPLSLEAPVECIKLIPYDSNNGTIATPCITICHSWNSWRSPGACTTETSTVIDPVSFCLFLFVYIISPCALFVFLIIVSVMDPRDLFGDPGREDKSDAEWDFSYLKFEEPVELDQEEIDRFAYVDLMQLQDQSHCEYFFECFKNFIFKSNNVGEKEVNAQTTTRKRNRSTIRADEIDGHKIE